MQKLQKHIVRLLVIIGSVLSIWCTTSCYGGYQFTLMLDDFGSAYLDITVTPEDMEVNAIRDDFIGAVGVLRNFYRVTINGQPNNDLYEVLSGEQIKIKILQMHNLRSVQPTREQAIATPFTAENLLLPVQAMFSQGTDGMSASAVPHPAHGMSAIASPPSQTADDGDPFVTVRSDIVNLLNFVRAIGGVRLLDIGNNNLDDNDVEIIVLFLHRNRYFIHGLELCCNYAITDLGATTLAQNLRRLRLQYLGLAQTNVDTQGHVAFINVLGNNRFLHYLDLSTTTSNIPLEGWAGVLRSNVGLDCLKLSQNDINFDENGVVENLFNEAIRLSNEFRTTNNMRPISRLFLTSDNVNFIDAKEINSDEEYDIELLEQYFSDPSTMGASDDESSDAEGGKGGAQAKGGSRNNTGPRSID